MNNKVLKKLIIILIIIVTLGVPNIKYGANTTLKIGDINGDKIIDSRDTIRILEHIAASSIPAIKQKHPNWILTGEKFKAGDINEDGIVDSRDTLRELEYIAASSIPTIAQKHPDWKKYIESKWTIKAIGITLNSANITIEKGKTSKLVATVTPINATNKTITWSSSDATVATVDGIGNVTGKNVGITIITAKLSNGLAKTCKVTIKEAAKTPVSTNPTTPTKQEPTKPTPTKPTPTKPEPTTPTPTKPEPTKPTVKTKNISSVSTKLSVTSLIYNGRVQTPAVILKDGKTTLTKGKDYLVSYANNKNVGTAVVTITGKGNYTGKVTKTFKINKATYNTKNMKFSNSKVIYDGNIHFINVTGIPAGVKVTYIGNGRTKVGTYTVTAKFVGDSKNYNTIKERKATLKIIAKSISKTTVLGIQNKYYTGNAITQNIIIKDGNRILKNGTDYIVKYENNTKIGNNAKVIITGKGNYIGTVTKSFNIVAIKGTKLMVSAPMWRQLEKGRFGQLIAKVSPDNATYKTITWTSSNPKAVKVNNSGTIHVVGHGIAKITATQKENGLTATYIIVGYTPPKSISFDPDSKTITKGETSKLIVNFNPIDVSSKEVTWKSSNPDIVSIDSTKTINGEVIIRAKSVGTATITATHKYGKAATCKIEVKKPIINVTDIRLNKTSITLTKGKTKTLKCTIYPTNATNKKVSWSSSDSNIVEVSNGKLKAKNAGVAIITVKSSNGKTATCKVEVKNPVIDVTDIALNKTSIKLTKGKTKTLKYSIYPSNATNKTVSWSSSDPNIVEVSNGKLIAKNAGKATITVKSSNGKIATCKVKVKNPVIPVSKIVLNTTYLKLKLGESKQLKAKVYPENATNKSIFWTPHGPDSYRLISVDDNGVVKADKGNVGSTTVAVYSKSTNNVVAYCHVYIEK